MDVAVTFPPKIQLRFQMKPGAFCASPRGLGTDMKTILITAASVLALTAAAGAQAQPAAADTTTLDTLYVTTPLRRASSLERSTSSVTVIGEDEIRSSASRDLPALLKHYAGVSISTNGGMGSMSNVQLRGMSSGQSLVLINGVRTASATTGTSSIFNIPLSAIERIEIAKGPHSAQYGADAMGGVINIITKKGGTCGDGKSVCGSVTAGVSHPWGGQVSGDVRGQANGFDYALGASFLGTQGYDFTYPDSWGHEPGDNGFLQGSVNLSGGKDFDWGRIYADILASRARTEYDNAPSGWGPAFNVVDTTTLSGRIGARIDHAHDWATTVELTGGADMTRDFRRGTPGSDEFETTRYGLLASTEKTFETDAATHVLVGGFETYRESVKAPAAYDVTSRTLVSGFAQYSLDLGALTLDSGIRYDHNQQFGDATTYNVGASYELVDGLVARASYGTGFRAPTFNDLYYPGYDNPNLKPEHSETVEVGLNWQATPDTQVDLVFYQSWLRDMIVSSPPFYLPFNVGRAQVRGFEASVAHRFDARWSGRAWVDVREPIDRDTGLFIQNRDRLKLGAEVSVAATENLDLSTKVLYVGERHTNAANTTKAKPYVTVDVMANYRFDDVSSLKLAVENLFDEQYASAPGYRAPGRTINVSYTRQF